MKFSLRSEAVSLLMLGGMFAWAIYVWPTAPDQIPVHFDLSGTPDRFGGKMEGLLLAPAIALAAYLSLIFAPSIDPRRKHYEAFSGPLTIIRTAVVGLMLGITAIIHLSMRGQAVSVTLVAPVVIGIIFLVVGNYLPKVKSNWFIGVRTPWTLSSEESWRRTHRLAGWLFAVSGAIVVLATLIKPQAGVVTLIASALTTAILSTVYSYVVWKNDSAR